MFKTTENYVFSPSSYTPIPVPSVTCTDIGFYCSKRLFHVNKRVYVHRLPENWWPPWQAINAGTQRFNVDIVYSKTVRYP